MSQRAKVKYRYTTTGVGTVCTSTIVHAKGKSESAVMSELQKKHRNIKELIIENIDWL
ncbi:hypothetical protein [Francisella philomiragia]|uniref:hypothetical protein n=1 Tax=Francisella philomiragia TaxID=28110 RepID=UPI001905494D|nr:hypothetical protein [Francisella philomiragia]MBK2105672.1 hypothetical protein [Francisella philomiragia]